MPILKVNIKYLYLKDVESLGPVLGALYVGTPLDRSGWSDNSPYYIDDVIERFQIIEPRDDQLRLMTEDEWNNLREKKNAANSPSEEQKED